MKTKEKKITHDYTNPCSSLGLSNKNLCIDLRTEFTRIFPSVTQATTLYTLQRYETDDKSFR